MVEGLLYNQHIDPVTYNVKFNTLDGLEFSAKEVLSFFGFGFAILDLDNCKFSFYSKDNKVLYSTNLTEDFRFAAPAISKS